MECGAVVERHSDSDMTSEAIANQLLSKIDTTRYKLEALELNKVSTYTADNDSVNYGGHNGVFQKLRTRLMLPTVKYCTIRPNMLHQKWSFIVNFSLSFSQSLSR